MFKKLTSKHKLLILVGLLSLASIIYLVLAIKPSSVPSNPTLPSPTVNFLPLKLIYIDPPSGVQSSFWTTTAIEFKFDQPINPASLAYKITPQLELVSTLGANPQSIYLRPKEAWATNTPYQLIITNLVSSTESKLITPIIYAFSIVPPTDIISY